jgi:hypothetical protein
MILQSEEATEKAESILDDMPRFGFIRDLMIKAKTRSEFGGVAANIAEDRYSAGSSAAQCCIVIMLRHGVDAALDFAKDLGYHES